MSGCAIRRVSSRDVLELRRAVLRAGRPLQDAVFDGDDDPDAFHAAATLDGRVVGVATILHRGRDAGAPGGAPPIPEAHRETAWQVRGLATADGLRGRGVGAATLAACLDHAGAHGGTWAWCNARTGAVGFYEAQGWSVVGPRFDIPTVGAHVVMELPLGAPGDR